MADKEKEDTKKGAKEKKDTKASSKDAAKTATKAKASPKASAKKAPASRAKSDATKKPAGKKPTAKKTAAKEADTKVSEDKSNEVDAPAATQSNTASSASEKSASAGGGGAKLISTALGEVAWLMHVSNTHKQLAIGDLEWMVMPALTSGQFRMFYDQGKLVGVAFYAFVNEPVEARLRSGQTRLRAEEWRCGEQAWLIEIIAPFGGTTQMIEDMSRSVFKDRSFRAAVMTKDGNRKILEFNGQPA